LFLNTTAALRGRTAGGYNTTWNIYKPQTAAFDSGSTFVFTAESALGGAASVHPLSLDGAYIGERTSEGYGELHVYDFSEAKSEYLITKEVNGKAPDADNPPTPYERKSDLAFKILEKAVNYQIIHDAVEKAAQANDSINSTTLGKLALMLKESPKLEDFYEKIKDVKIEEKKDAITAIIGKRGVILENVNKSLEKVKLASGSQPLASTDEGLTERLKENMDKLSKIYLDAYLTQLKLKKRSST
jgi:hypothetical protein